MILEQPSIKRQPIILEHITATFAEFDQVVEDMFAHAGEFMATPNWATLDPAPCRPTPMRSHSPAAPILRSRSRITFPASTRSCSAGSASRGSNAVEAWLIRLYAAFFDGFDPLGLWRHNVVDREAGQTLHNADLSSIRELSLIHAFAPTRDQAVTAVVEVGGGYMFDCYIVPSWHFERLNSARYDVCVNVDSFQEMSQILVDRYLELFDSVLQPEGIVYNSNGRGSYFKGTWNFPGHWRKGSAPARQDRGLKTTLRKSS